MWDVSGYLNISWAVVIPTNVFFFNRQLHMCSSQQRPWTQKTDGQFEPWVESRSSPHNLRSVIGSTPLNFDELIPLIHCMMLWKRPERLLFLLHQFGVRYPCQNVGWQLWNYLGKHPRNLASQMGRLDWKHFQVYAGRMLHYSNT